MPRAARLLLVLVALAAPAPARAQDVHVLHSVDSLETWLSEGPIEVIDFRGSRGAEDRTQRAALRLADSLVVLVKWARFAPGGETFNNVPRYEIAAYALQKFFLDEPDYVVPPTVPRVVELDWYREKLDPEAIATFDDTSSILVLLQYWLNQVTVLAEPDTARLRAEPRYARHIGNLNILSYLIRHSDSNVGNFLVSVDTGNPRAFAVDNGVAFGSSESARGTAWREIRVPALPQDTVERLRAITEEDLERALGVLLQFEIREGVVVPVPPGENLRTFEGVRRDDDVIQFGLTENEVAGTYDRLQRLLRDIDRGRVTTF
jgi:hypothetical protein